MGKLNKLLRNSVPSDDRGMGSHRVGREGLTGGTGTVAWTCSSRPRVEGQPSRKRTQHEHRHQVRLPEPGERGALHQRLSTGMWGRVGKETGETGQGRQGGRRWRSLELFSVMSREVLSDLALQVLRQGLPTTVE